jgi:hypothetical protein
MPATGFWGTGLRDSGLWDTARRVVLGGRSTGEPGPVVNVVRRGDRALIVGLHGYGGDEHQLATLAPLNLPVRPGPLRPPRHDPVGPA